jgi:DNA-binding NarL/FixJ family response regulator
MIKVLIVDDHPIVRVGIKQIIAKAEDISIEDEASNGGEALVKILERNFDVVLLDISLPGMGGLEVLKQIRAKKPNLPVLILSMHPEKQYSIRSLKMGASGYLTKESAPFELIKAVRSLSQGGKYISSSLALILASYLDKVERKPHETLSYREYQVMCMISSGKNRAEIAEELSLNIKTVGTYRMRTLKKMKMKNDVELSHYAIQNHLID